MNIDDLKRIIASFSDNGSDVQIKKGELVAVIREELIEAKIDEHEGTIYVQEKGSERTSARNWIINRIANLHLLAERIVEYFNANCKGVTFVHPSGAVLEDIELNPEENENMVEDVFISTLDMLNKRMLGSSKITYLTSDAGEGKTTMINFLSKHQAEEFKAKRSSWLLVPIPLGGRPFLRFDDIVIASLVNRLRFRSFYFESFIELVKMGVIIPAFDGFEEMFMAGSSGEALSATGQLLNKLDSKGVVLIAARKAFYNYNNFANQAKLFDSISHNTNVSFCRVALHRWTREEFVEYSAKVGIINGEEIYNLAAKKLGPNHPLLSRAVLVCQLFDVYKQAEDIQTFVEKLNNTRDYFAIFVRAILSREIETKWIDTSGEPYKPLISENQHYDLLCYLAEEMWLNSTDHLRLEVVELLCELYSETENLSPKVAIQIKERIKHHALIVNADGDFNLLKFDHDEFREHFLGIGIAQKFLSERTVEFKNLMRRGALPDQAIEIIAFKLFDNRLIVEMALAKMDLVLKGEASVSFLRENCGKIVLKLLEMSPKHGPVTLTNYFFTTNSIIASKLQDLNFVNCTFQSTSLQHSVLERMTFTDCSFERVEIATTSMFDDVKIKGNTKIHSLYVADKDNLFFDPINIYSQLIKLGVEVEGPLGDSVRTRLREEPDIRLIQTEKVLRKFIRATTITDNIIKIRVGAGAEDFLKNVLPDLINHGYLQEITYYGAGNKRTFKLSKPLSTVLDAFTRAEGNYRAFLNM